MSTHDFGQVSRTVGTVFRYALLAATLVGVVALGILLLFVAVDAIQPLTADPGWHLTFFLSFVLPTLAVSGYLYLRAPDSLRAGGAIVGLLAVTTMFAGGVVLIFVDIVSPIAWFGFVLALALPAGVLALVSRTLSPGMGTSVGLGALLLYLSLAGVPGPLGGVVGLAPVAPSVIALVGSIPVLPVDWMLLAVSVSLPVGLLAGSYVASYTDRRGGTAALGLTVALGVAASLAAPSLGISAGPSLLLATVIGVPAGLAVWRSWETDRLALAVPAVVVGGAFVGAVAVELLGFAGPQSWVDWQFLTSAHSRIAEDAGLYPAIGGSILLMGAVIVLSFPFGVGAAIYMEEYAPDNRITRLIDVNISNLAGVPSVVYGLLGLGVFVRFAGQPTGTVLVGGATLSLLILPIIIISSREAIRSVPEEMRQASYGMGATRWQTVKNVVLPRAFPGILTGTILALGRAIGETAPLIMIGAPDVVFSLPAELSAKVSAMPLQVYAWATLYGSPEFYQKAVPAGVVVLVSVLLAMNSLAIVLRNRYQNEQ
ncbi:phosphate ABC transporter permease PstA [Halosegnis longus]|uniref:Phosphate transport system permease protein PstA n=1 Tax=Halosegnis longus TaxID=2216012 RepID=A0AAJ4UWQ4_9EURY|nr:MULTISPECIES: phosphate ABC transporter permease PstA [Halobacteriales]RNJ27367.1 phosphate ABC transporter permease PstA [Salella cibi]